MKTRDLIKMLVLTSVLLCSSQIHAATSPKTETSTDTTTVKNESKDYMADAMITAKVKMAFLNEKLFGKGDVSMEVAVETTDGVVYLTGTVDNQEQADNAVRLAKAVTGVRKVSSMLEVEVHENKQ